ncbi:MAG: VCBS repeat-containing protein [Deltaproteobacteria bacterium]|nr:VCBS repeat-containing protein [Deltaproteobacteria bacterium]
MSITGEAGWLAGKANWIAGKAGWITGKHLSVMTAVISVAAISLMFFSPSNGISDDRQGLLGDRSSVKVAVIPWRVHAEGNPEYIEKAVTDMLTSRVGSADGIEIIRKDIVSDAVKEYGGAEFTEKAAEDVGRKLGADYVLFGSFSLVGGNLSMDAKLLNLKSGVLKSLYSTGRGMDSAVDMTGELASDAVSLITGVPAAPRRAGGSYTGKFSTPQPSAGVAREGAEAELAEEGFIIKKKKGERGFIGKKRIGEGSYKMMEAADLDGDGKAEIAFLGEKEIVIAKVEGEGLKKVKVITAGDLVQNVSISAYDGDGDGRPELYVSRIGESFPDGCVLKYKDGTYALTSCGIQFFMRAVEVQGKGKILLGQGFRREGGFNKAVKVLKVEGAVVKDAGDFTLPPNVGIYDLALLDITGDGENDVVALDARGFMKIYTKRENGQWAEEWKSAESYGGDLNTIELAGGKESSARGFVSVNGRFLYADVNGDGALDVIIKKNVAGGIFGEMSERVMSFKNGSVRGLDWDGAVLAESWRTKDITGYIADFFIGDMDNNGEKDITILVVEQGGLFSGKETSALLSYKLTVQ